jgi:hypothetical protein
MNISPSLKLTDGSKGCCKLLQCSSYPCGSVICFSHANVLFNVFLKMDKLCSPVYQLPILFCFFLFVLFSE